MPHPPLTNENGKGEKQEWHGKELLAAPVIPEKDEGGWNEEYLLANRGCCPPLKPEKEKKE